MKLKGIIFDVDGTMADTEEIHRQAFNQAFQEFNLSWHWSMSDYYKLLFISGGKERFKICLDNDEELSSKINDPEQFIKDLHKCKSDHYRTMLASKQTQLRPGVKRLIEEAREKEIPLAIATSSCFANLKTLINTTLDKEPKELFGTIVCSDTITDKKPSPAVYQAALAGLHLAPESCIAIEDTRNGNIAALSASLNTIITTHDYTLDNDFSGAALVLNHLGEPDQAFSPSEGYTYDKTYVDLELIDNIISNNGDNSIDDKLLTMASNTN